MDIKILMQKLDRMSEQISVLGRIQQALLNEVLDLTPNRQDLMIKIMSNTFAIKSFRDEFSEYANGTDDDRVKTLAMDIQEIANEVKREHNVLKDLDFKMEEE